MCWKTGPEWIGRAEGSKREQGQGYVCCVSESSIDSADGLNAWVVEKFGVRCHQGASEGGGCGDDDLVCRVTVEST